MTECLTGRNLSDMRVLGRIRLSRFTQESTSVERQREIVEAWAAANSHEVVAWAVDVDLSRSVDPFDAPELGPWLRPDKAGDWDILAMWKLDRTATGSIYLNKVMSFCQDHGKSLVSIAENLDLSTWVGRMIANVIAGVAEGELEAIRERTQGSQAKLRELGRWHGGRPPYGYTAVKRPDGWRLVPEPTQAEIVREIIRRITDGHSVSSIAADLQSRGTPPPQGGRWWTQTVFHIVRSRAVVGQREHKGQTVIGPDGLPLQRADPLVPFDEWQAAKDILDDSRRPKVRKFDPGMLLDVAFCWSCGLKLYQREVIQKGRTYRYWRCSGQTQRRNGCKAASVRADYLESRVEEDLMEKIGDIEVRERVYLPGTDNSARRAQVDEAIETARREYDMGLYSGDRDGYLTRMGSLVERREALNAEPDSGPRWELRGTGVTYRERWDSDPSPVSRRGLLLDAGLTVKAEGKPFRSHVHINLDVLEQSFPGFVAKHP